MVSWFWTLKKKKNTNKNAFFKRRFLCVMNHSNAIYHHRRIWVAVDDQALKRGGGQCNAKAAWVSRKIMDRQVKLSGRPVGDAAFVVFTIIAQTCAQHNNL